MRAFDERVRTFAEVRIYPHLIRAIAGVEVGPRLRVRGFPLLQLHPTARIHLGDNVFLNSRNRGYHVNMHSPVKLLADRPDSEIVVGENTELNGVCIHAFGSIRIGAECLIAANTHIIDGSGHDLSFPDVERRRLTRGTTSPVVIEDCVWIGANTIVLPGTHIGRGSIIGAGSVVRGTIPPNVVAAGNPARVVRRYDPADGRPLPAALSEGAPSHTLPSYAADRPLRGESAV